MTNDFGDHPGYVGAHTQRQADGAYPNGTRVKKRNSEPGDGHQDGSLGTILGSVAPPPEMFEQFPDVTHFYFLEWDDAPRVAVGTVSFKLELAEMING